MNIVVLSLLSTIVFGVIDAVFFLLFEETIQVKLRRMLHISLIVAELLTGGFSGAAAIFASSKFRLSLDEDVFLINNPLLDVTGIVTGTLVVVFAYIFYRKYIKCYLFPNNC